MGGDDGARVLRGLVQLVESRSAEVSKQHSSCHDANTEEDDEFIDSVHRSLRAVETLPLERNEFKWADFFARYLRSASFCVAGIATLFLVAGDITAYAAGAVAGEHMMRLKRALLFAQGIVRHRIRSAPLNDQDVLRLDL